MRIYDDLQLIRADLCILAFGISASKPSLIFGGGTKGKNICWPQELIEMIMTLVFHPLDKSREYEDIAALTSYRMCFL